MSATHEDFGRETRRRGPSDRNFGFVFTAAFLFFCLWPLRHGKPVRLWCLALSGIFLLVSLIKPSLLHLLNRVWTRCGILLGKVVNPVVTALLFYLVFTPIAVILRLTGKDLLGIKFDPVAKSYWIRQSPAGSGSSMADQF